jgi:YidC/Oxa1 family membrane protein insertase
MIAANVLQPIIDVAEAIMVFFHDDLGFGWGAAIVGLTVVTRIVILPLTIKQIRSMQALQRLQPQIKEIQEKYKADRQRMQQEMMKFYRENKVNPLGSCLPLLLQLPVFIALFYTLQKDLRAQICGQTAKVCGEVASSMGEGWLFIPDLTDNATGGVLVTLILLYIGSQMAASLLMTVTADRQQRLLMIMLPLFFVLFIINFPAGLIVYWITTNVWTIGQQYVVRRLAPPPVVAGAPAAAGAAAAVPAKPPPPPPRKKKKRSGRRR